MPTRVLSLTRNSDEVLIRPVTRGSDDGFMRPVTRGSDGVHT